MSDKNLLINCVGRQSYLVESFKEALGNYGKVICSDTDNSALGLKAGQEQIIAKSFESEDYISWLIGVIKRHNIRLLMTLNVDDLLVLEKNRFLIEKNNCFLVGGNSEIIKKTYDKYKLFKMLAMCRIGTPETQLLCDINRSEKLLFPLIVKPRFGKGSRGIEFVSSKGGLDDIISRISPSEQSNYILQEIINGEEYGVDIVNDFQKRFATAHVRKKIKMLNGETNVAITQSNEDWLVWALKLSQLIQCQGTIDIDLMVRGNRRYIIDINHRFGGGYIFSHIAGAKTPNAYVSWFMGTTCQPEWLYSKPGIIGVRRTDGLVDSVAEYTF